MGKLNGRADVQAWRALFEGTVELLHIPTWPAPAKILVDPGTFAGKLRDLDRSIASYLAEILALWSKEYEAPGTRKELWDPACIAAVADPGSVTAGPQTLATLDAVGAHDFTQPGRVASVVSDLDERRILAGLMEALTRHPTAWMPQGSRNPGKRRWRDGPPRLRRLRSCQNLPLPRA